jgi:hypothetical protein
MDDQRKEQKDWPFEKWRAGLFNFIDEVLEKTPVTPEEIALQRHFAQLVVTYPDKYDLAEAMWETKINYEATTKH